MKWAIVTAVFCGLMLLSGIGITISDWQSETVYETSGEYLMTSSEWEQFKIDLYNDEYSDIKDVTYLDSGELKLVSFEDMRVEEDFAWGELANYDQKIRGGAADDLGAGLVFWGAFGLLLWCLITILIIRN